MQPLLAVVQRNRTYHHFTYMVAQTYALGGRSADAIHWLTETVDNGFPNYPLLASDPALNRIRSAPEFTSLLTRVQKEFEVLRDAARM